MRKSKLGVVASLFRETGAGRKLSPRFMSPKLPTKVNYQYARGQIKAPADASKLSHGHPQHQKMKINTWDEHEKWIYQHTTRTTEENINRGQGDSANGWAGTPPLARPIP